MLTLYAVEYSGETQCYQHTVLVEYDKVPKDYKTWRQDDFFDTFLMSAITDGAKWFKIIYSCKIDLGEKASILCLQNSDCMRKFTARLNTKVVRTDQLK